jgi:hypothetical protein
MQISEALKQAIASIKETNAAGAKNCVISKEALKELVAYIDGGELN